MLWVVPQFDVSDFPDHLASEVGHVGLGESKVLFATGECLQELAGENTTVIAVFLLWRILAGTE